LGKNFQLGFLESSEGELVKDAPDFYGPVMETFKPHDSIPPRFEFTYMKNIGVSTICQNKVPSSPPSSLDPFINDFIARNPEHNRIFDYCNHSSATNNVERYIKSLKKCDFPMKKPDDSFMRLAEEYTYRMLAPSMSYKKSSTKVDYNPHTSNGPPFQRVINPSTGIPFKDKQEFLNTKLGQDAVSATHTPLFGVTGKVELLPTAEVVDGKMRTYFIGETPLVMKQKLLYDNQDEAMTSQATNFSKFWSRYGLRRQYGGINQLGKAHMSLHERLRKRIYHKMCDISGWDRVMPVLPEVYRIRKRLFGNMNPNEEKYHDYCAQHISKPYCCLFNGQIIQRQTGNCSGSGKTTSDNTIGHIFIDFYVYITLFYEKHGRVPTFEEIVDTTVLSLYGDDDLSSFCLDDWVPDHVLDKESYYANRYSELYQLFGMTIKASAFLGQFDTIEGLEFLGATFRYDEVNQLYVGQPRWSKIATSICFLLEKDRDLVQRISIISAASSLCDFVPGETADYIRKFLRDYSRYILTKDLTSVPSSNVVFLSSVANGSYTNSYLTYGFESNPSTLFCDFQSPFFLSIRAVREMWWVLKLLWKALLLVVLVLRILHSLIMLITCQWPASGPPNTKYIFL
jgi:hypothetical protein